MLSLKDCQPRIDGYFERVNSHNGEMQFSKVVKDFYGPWLADIMKWKCRQCPLKPVCLPEINNQRVISQIKEP